jgi:DNA-binding HxlR family transcriptional regulator
VSETTPSESESHQLAAGHRELLDQILDKWSLQVLEHLCNRPSRFNDCAENFRR